MTNLYDIGQWFEDKGLVGEKSLALVNTVVAVSGKPMGFGLEAPAGSGKTVTMDLVVGDESGTEGIIKAEHIFFKDAGSETSFFYDAETINSKKIIVFKELQKDKSSTTIEAIKSLTEGKIAGRSVTDMTKKSTVRQEIQPKTVMYTLAIENDTKPDAELRRRCITMATDVSKEQTHDVLALRSKQRWDVDASKVLTAERSNAIRKDVNSILMMDYKILNPFAQFFAEYVAKIAPDQKVRSMIEHFWNVMEGVTKLNSTHRAVKGTDIICNIQDLAMTLDIYKPSFLRDVYSIPPLGDVILKAFDDAEAVTPTEKGQSNVSLAQYGASLDNSQWYDINHLRKTIKEKQKIVLAKNVVIQICKQLVDAGYLEDWKDGTIIKYQIQEQFKEFAQPNWSKLVDDAAVLVKAKFPTLYSRWYDQQFEQYVHPIMGNAVQLITKKGLLDELEEDIM